MSVPLSGDQAPGDEDVGRLVAVADPGEQRRLLAALGLLDDQGLARALEAAGTAMYDDPAAGARLAQTVHDAAVDHGVANAVASSTYLLAQAAVHGGELHDALRLLDEAERGFEAVGERARALRTNLGRTHVLNELGRHEEALAASRAILEAAGSGDAALVEDSLAAAAEQNSGLCLELMGRFEDALAAYSRAEARYGRTGSDRATAEVAFDRALVLLTLGRHGDALDALETSAATFRQGGFRRRLAEALSQLAEVHLERGALQRCLAALEEARRALETIDAPVESHQRSLVAGRAYLALHLLPEAVATFEDAVRFLEATDLVVEQARARWGNGLALAAAGRLDDAATALDRALDRFRRSGHDGWVAAVLVDRARLARRRDLDEPARRSATEALQVAELAAVPVVAVHALLTLAELDEDHAQAMERLRQASTIAERLGLAPLRAAVQHAVGRLLARDGRHTEAEPLLRAAVDAVETARGGLDDDALLRRYLDDKRSPYEDLIEVLIALDGDAAEIAELCDRSRSRALTELMAGLAARLGPSALDAEEATVLADLRAAQSALFTPQPVDEDRRALLLERLAQLEQRAGLLAVQRSQRTIRYGMVEAAPRASGRDGGLARDDATVPIVSYLCANGVVHAFVHRGDGGPAAGSPVLVRAVAPVAEVAALVHRLENHFARIAAGGARIERHLAQQLRATDAVLRELHGRLLAPVEAHLALHEAHLAAAPGVRPLVIVPDGPLHGVPFAALLDGTTPMRDRYALSLAPSVEAAQSTVAPVDGTTVVAGAGDELAALVDDEVRSVAAHRHDAIVLVGEEASWARVRAAIAGAGHLHLAGHAVFRPDNPMYSAIRLADGWVTAADLLELDLTGRTVVLSACGTARTTVASAEVVGFTRALLGAGARTTVTSLWAADDRATVQFMEELYRLLRSCSPVEAIRRAQQATAQTFPHPYHWAPWVVHGGR